MDREENDLPDVAAAYSLTRLDRGLRPTQIVVRNLAVTQTWGYAVWNESDPHDAKARRWDAVSWWSDHHPGWPVDLQELQLEYPAIVEAAKTLNRVLP